MKLGFRKIGAMVTAFFYCACTRRKSKKRRKRRRSRPGEDRRVGCEWLKMGLGLSSMNPVAFRRCFDWYPFCRLDPLPRIKTRSFDLTLACSNFPNKVDAALASTTISETSRFLSVSQCKRSWCWLFPGTNTLLHRTGQLSCSGTLHPCWCGYMVSFSQW